MKRHFRVSASLCLLLVAVLAMTVPLSLTTRSLAVPVVPCPDFYWQNPLPQGNNLNDIEALSASVAIAAGDNGVILKTVDGGANWVSLVSGVGEDLLAVSAVNVLVIWMAGSSGTILKTVDGGANWVSQVSPTGTDINDICAVSTNVAWAASDGDMAEGGIPLRTTDGGTTWEKKLDPVRTFALLTGVSALSADAAWVCGPGELARTINGGAAWDKEKAPQESYINRIRMFDVNKAVAVGYGGAFFRTVNGGADWSRKDLGVDIDINSLSFLNDQNGWIVGDNGFVALTADGGDSWDNQESGVSDVLLGVSAPTTGNAWACGYSGTLIKTPDGGANWQGLGSGDRDGLFAICSVGDRFDSTILKTCDGGNRWISQVAPVTADYFGVSAWNEELAWAVGQQGTIIHTADGGNNWQAQPAGTTRELTSVAAASDNVVWAGGVDILLKTEDGGAAWKQVTNVNIKGSLQAEAVEPLIAWVCGSGGNVAKTVDGGGTWQEQTLSMGADYVVSTVTCISALNADVAYATVIANKKDNVGDFSVVFRTVDGGATWNNTFAAGHGQFDLFAVTVADVDTAWAGGLFGLILKTDDGGNTWVQQQALTDNIVNALVSTDGQTAWLAARGGNILRTTSPVAYAATPSQGLDTNAALSFKVEGLGFQDGMSIELIRSGQPTLEGKTVNVISPREATCVFDLAGAAEGAWDVVVTNTNGLFYTLTGAFQVVSATRWYLAEGSTGVSDQGNFETWILLQNPEASAATVNLTYLTSSGKVTGPSVPMPPHSRATVNVGETVPGDWSVATMAESDQPIIAENSLYWNQAGGNYRQTCGESIGVSSLANRWYLAEGSTGENEVGSFETWVLLGNPGAETATATLTYMTAGGVVEGPIVDLAPGTRMSVNVADTLPNEWSVSTLVESEKPIMAERTLYWDAPDASRTRLSSTSSIGTIAPSMQWYLAEGSTGANDQGSFETWILVENPGDYVTTADLYYQTPTGQVDGPSIELAPMSRMTVNVAETVPTEFSVSTLVRSNNPVVCERSTYWNAGDTIRWSATGSIGATAPSTYWDLAEGSTGADDQGNFETWILIQNPLFAPASIEITYMTPEGQVTGPAKVVPPLSRITVNVGETVPNQWSVSTAVKSDLPVVVERAVYWSTAASFRQAASGSVGTFLLVP
jgi:photosystem II stability/assembly factor-like uncharacterized protein